MADLRSTSVRRRPVKSVSVAGRDTLHSPFRQKGPTKHSPFRQKGPTKHSPFRQKGPTYGLHTMPARWFQP